MKITSSDLTTRREQIKATRANLAALVETFQTTRENTPAETVAALVNRLGYDTAAETVAELVNSVGEWDGRIFPSVREWANTISTAATREELAAVSIYQPSDIHPAHINQIGKAMSKYTPEPEEPTEPETAPEEPATPADPFPMLRAAVLAENAANKAEEALYIERGYMSSWADEHRTEPDRGLKQYSTATRWDAYKAGTITREKAVELATRRALKEIDKTTAAKLDKLDRAAAVPALAWAEISVEWVRSSTWGNNPHATAWAGAERTEGSASGCGYDKGSTAVAEALNRIPAALRVLYELKETALQSGATLGNLAHTTHSNEPFTGYGGGYGVLPYFEGGVGCSCFWAIFKNAGYTVHADERAKRYDHYTINKEVA